MVLKLQGNISNNQFYNKTTLNLQHPSLLANNSPSFNLDKYNFQTKNIYNNQIKSKPTSFFNSVSGLLDTIKKGVVGLFISKNTLNIGSNFGLNINSDINDVKTVTAKSKDSYGKSVKLSPLAAHKFDGLMKIANSKGVKIKVSSSYRTVDHQKKLFDKALNKYGSYNKARKWVAPPGKSNHNLGNAIDMSIMRNGKKVSQKEFDAIITEAGFYRPMAYEGWHIEPIETKNIRKGNYSHKH